MIPKTISLVVVMLLVTGIFQHRHRRRHITLMLVAMGLDGGMVLFLELTRGAVEKAAASASLMLHVHVAISVAVLIGYVALAVTGVRYLRGKRPRPHRRLGLTTFVLRCLNFITSLFV